MKRREQAIAIFNTQPNLTAEQVAQRMGIHIKTARNYLIGSTFKTKQLRRWTSEEEAFLERRAETLTLAQLAKKLNRSELSVWAKAVNMGLTLRPTLNNFSAATLAENLGITRSCVQGWIRSGLLQAVHDGRGKRYRITKRDFAAFVAAHPERVKGVSREVLEWLGVELRG